MRWRHLSGRLSPVLDLTSGAAAFEPGAECLMRASGTAPEVVAVPVVSPRKRVFPDSRAR